jgi:hypothetical protein
LLVEKMGSKFNGNAVELLKSMCQQKTFAFSVKAGSLHIGSVPCGAYFQAFVGRVNVHVGGHAHRLTMGHDSEWQHAALLLQFQAPGYFFAHFVGSGNEGVPMAPELTIIDRFCQLVVV